MRAELRVEIDAHEYEVILEADQSVSPRSLIDTAASAVTRLLNEGQP